MIAALRFSENLRFDEHKRGTIRTQSRAILEPIFTRP